MIFPVENRKIDEKISKVSGEIQRSSREIQWSSRDNRKASGEIQWSSGEKRKSEWRNSKGDNKKTEIFKSRFFVFNIL